MDLITFLIVVAVFVAWGSGSFIAKLAANRIGAKGVFFDILGYAPAIIVYSLVMFKLKNLIQTDKFGMGLAF